jgi:MarR family transcriptional regulator, organic hydroperoxide resistance regulator
VPSVPDPHSADQHSADQPSADQRSWEVADCFFELIGSIVGQAEQLAHRLSVPAPFIKALHTLDCPMAMKELGKRMHCDPSFVTLVADMLEKRGLARREPHPADRRIKNLVLTEQGEALKSQVEAELTARMPWNRALNDSERAQLLALIRKMLSAGNGEDAGASAEGAVRGPLASLITAALQDSIVQASAQEAKPTSPPASAGEVNDVVSQTSAAR